MDLDYRFWFFFLNYCLDCSPKKKIFSRTDEFLTTFLFSRRLLLRYQRFQ